jgi:predicted RNase H-like nuclease (RuvC/YqgF family)
MNNNLDENTIENLQSMLITKNIDNIDDNITKVSNMICCKIFEETSHQYHFYKNYNMEDEIEQIKKIFLDIKNNSLDTYNFNYIVTILTDLLLELKSNIIKSEFDKIHYKNLAYNYIEEMKKFYINNDNMVELNQKKTDQLKNWIKKKIEGDTVINELKITIANYELSEKKYIDQINDLIKKNSELINKNIKLNKEINNINNKNCQFNKDINNLNIQFNKDIDNLNKEIDNLNKDIDNLNNRINELTINSENLNNQHNKITVNNIKLSYQNNELTDEIKKLNHKINELSNEKSKLIKDNEILNDQYEILNKDNEQLTNDINDLAKENNQIIRDYNNLSQNYGFYYPPVIYINEIPYYLYI